MDKTRPFHVEEERPLHQKHCDQQRAWRVVDDSRRVVDWFDDRSEAEFVAQALNERSAPRTDHGSER